MPSDTLRGPFRSATAIVALILGGTLAAYFFSFEDEYPKAVRSGPFLATPYLQLGEADAADALTLAWHADDADAAWSVEVRSPVDSPWRVAGTPTMSRVVLEKVEAQRVYRARMEKLAAGETFRYRVKLGGQAVFEAEAHAKAAPGKPQRFVALGDCSAGTPGQRKVAYQIGKVDPDYMVVTGDIVYFAGRLSEYRTRFFPIYGAEEASPEVGAPLLRRTPIVGVPGNHDLWIGDLDRQPDLLAYYYLWSQPLNGPTQSTTGKLATPVKGAEGRVRAFKEAAGANFPRMANFSFDQGDVHWLVLDSNFYVMWSDPELRAWVLNDLLSAADKPWRFVTFHHPGFNSSREHAPEQQMRLLADLFEKGGVSIVFSGHVHNYQRTYPLKFAPETFDDGRTPPPGRPVPGKWTLDRAFDGDKQSRPDGVIYLVTGAGGAKLYDPDQGRKPETWQPFTRQFLPEVHSFTVVDVTPNRVDVKQVDRDGTPIDGFAVTR